MKAGVILLILGVFLSGCSTVRFTNMSRESQLKRLLDCQVANYTNIPPFLWEQLPVTFSFDGSIPKEVIPAIKRAASRWNATVGFRIIRFSSEQTENSNLIIWDLSTKRENISIVAETTTNFVLLSFIHAEISIYAGIHSFSTGRRSNDNSVDLEATMVHEFGHVFGLDHTSSGIMIESSELTPEERHIDRNSMEAVKCLYSK